MKYASSCIGITSVELPQSIAQLMNYVKIIPVAAPPQLSLCRKIGDMNVLLRDIHSSDLRIPKSPFFYARVAANASLSDSEIKVSKYLRFLLGKSEYYYIEPIDIDQVQKAERVELTPIVNEFQKIQIEKFPQFIKIGGFIPLISDQVREHAIYGQFWTDTYVSKIAKINGQNTEIDNIYYVNQDEVQVVENPAMKNVDFQSVNSKKWLLPRPLELGWLRKTYEALKLYFRLDSRPMALLVGGAGCGKRYSVNRASSHQPLVEHSLYNTTKLQELRDLFESLPAPWTLLVRHFAEGMEIMTWQQPDQAGKIAHTLYDLAQRFPDISIIASCRRDTLPIQIRTLFTVVIEVQKPDEDDRKAIAQQVFSLTERPFSESVLNGLAGKSIEDIIRICKDPNPTAIQKDNSIPDVHWEDIGGLDTAKEDIIDTVQLPLTNPNSFASGIRQRSGLLLYGPPGTGKTLLAKAVATECRLNFISVKGPEMLNMYIGESEKNIREVFAKARDAKPSVLFFDEIDALAPARGSGSDSGGVVDRIVSQLLTELDGAQQATDVFVISATNRPDLLDPALLRPGRFDKLIGLDICQSHGDQEKILRALTRKFKVECDLQAIAESCELNMTGADFFAICSDALLAAHKAVIDKLEARWEASDRSVPLEQLYDEDVDQVIVTNDHFAAALSEFKPSVSQDEIIRYRDLRSDF